MGPVCRLICISGNNRTYYLIRFARENPDASVDSLQSLKDFVRHVAYGIKGMEGIDGNDDTDDEGDDAPPGVETVRNYWNNFTGAWKRIHPPIREDLIESVTQVCFHLQLY